MRIFIIATVLVSNSAMAFVSGPSSVNAGEQYLSIGTQAERGKVEPNENKASFQSAQINIYKLKYVRGLESLPGLSTSNVYFVHEADKQLGFYAQLSPGRTYNKNKFSNPRLDLFALGLTTSFNVTDNLFQRNLIHYGSGDTPSQNAYLVVDTGFGYRLNQLAGRPFTIAGSLFFEADMTERTDPSYDAAFSPSGTQDRIRAFKYGTLLGVDVALTNKVNLNINYLQKLGGYDARSTQIYTANIGYKF